MNLRDYEEWLGDLARLGEEGKVYVKVNGASLGEASGQPNITEWTRNGVSCNYCDEDIYPRAAYFEIGIYRPAGLVTWPEQKYFAYCSKSCGVLDNA